MSLTSLIEKLLNNILFLGGGGVTIHMWQYNSTDELYHYGVLGMKWGVHKLASKYGTSSSELNRRAKESGKAYKSSAEKSNRADKTYSSAKKRYEKAKKTGTGVNEAKSDLRSAKKEKKTAQKEFNKASSKYNRDQSRASKRNRDDETWNTVESHSPVKKIQKLSKSDKKKAAAYAVAACAGLAVTNFIANGGAKKAGRAAVEAYLKVTGGTNITWLD